ncbi:MAG: sugar phosphate isomerase/epimerase [Akkermansiaceae bacterium]|nr:sugar phosphate isomerase/epimerase [Armatimonadota bacterium]
MKLSLNGARLGAGNLNLMQFVDLAARHGFSGVDTGVGAAKQLVETLGDVSAANDYLLEKGVVLATFGLDVQWRNTAEAFSEGIAKLPVQAELMASLGCTRCLTWMLPSSDVPQDEWMARTVRRFTEVGTIFGDNGIRFGLEWVGPHHLRTGGANAAGPYETVTNIPTTLELIRSIGRDNIGLLVDSYHCYTTGAGEAEVAALTDAQIVHVHINDAPKGVGPAGAKDGERLLPGEGEIDLDGFLRGLKTAGYTGYIAAEVLAPQDLAPNAEEGADKVRTSLRNLGL